MPSQDAGPADQTRARLRQTPHTAGIPRFPGLRGRLQRLKPRNRPDLKTYRLNDPVIFGRRKLPESAEANPCDEPLRRTPISPPHELDSTVRWTA
ncbi:hypothetical protein GCM10010230_23970 [Streptomyces narbonensis]|nr:hypothetical protein GCM10010230_23970 [Streptomyces narbonensis]